MGTYKKSTFGEISGAVGEGVGSKWRGVKVIRSTPAKSGKPASLAQLAVQAKFALSAARLGPIKDVLNLGFSDKKLNKITGYNAAVKAFMANSIVGEYPAYSVDYTNMQVSKGSLIGLSRLAMALGEGLELSWTSSANTLNAFEDDRVIALVYNENKNAYMLNDSSQRSATSLAMAVDGDLGNVLHVWVFCTKRDGKAVSPSQYLGTITISEVVSI